MNDTHAIKQLVTPLRRAMYDFDESTVNIELDKLFSQDAKIHMAHPMGDLQGPTALYQQCYAPLFEAMPDLERRDFIVIGGNSDQGSQWVGCAGNYVGTFVRPWLNIPPTGQFTHMRFHEFYRFEQNKVVEMQAIWDIPEVMLQANAWPMAPSLGWEGCVPSPASQDGLVLEPYNSEKSNRSSQHVIAMLEHLIRHPAQGGPEVMELERFWHPRMNWYGPSGIGTARGVAGFRNWHQIPFLKAMPDRGQYEDQITHHFFADGDYVAVTGWPNMSQTVSADGWLGIAPAGKRVTLCSLDFWRLEKGLIRENWVLIDLLDLYRQLGVDVFKRLAEFNKSRNLGAINFPVEEE